MANQTIDSQVPAYERTRPERPWTECLQGPVEVTSDDMVTSMDAVGVEGALLVSPFGMYRYDASYALDVYAKHPGPFGLIKPFDPQSKPVADDVAEWAGTPGVVGARIMLTAQPFVANDPGLNRILAAGAQAGFPVNVMCSGRLPLLRELARRHPDTQVVVDHVGLIQPPESPAPPEPFADLANVVSLAACDNVAIKISGACTLCGPYLPQENPSPSFGFPPEVEVSVDSWILRKQTFLSFSCYTNSSRDCSTQVPLPIQWLNWTATNDT